MAATGGDTSSASAAFSRSTEYTSAFAGMSATAIVILSSVTDAASLTAATTPANLLSEDRVNLAITPDVNTFSTITDGHDRLLLGFADRGAERFLAGMVSLGDGGSLTDYANAVVAAAGNASIDGVFGWFHSPSIDSRARKHRPRLGNWVIFTSHQTPAKPPGALMMPAGGPPWDGIQSGQTRPCAAGMAQP